MRNYLLPILCLLVSTAAFTPVAVSPSGSITVCFAKHVNDKAAKWAASKRPKKRRLSDINRKPTNYELDKMEKPPEFTILEDDDDDAKEE